MGFFDGKNTAQAFSRFLDYEKALILRGDIAAVHRMAVEKERFLKKLARPRFQRHNLADLKRRAERNSDLLLASARGFKAVQDQLAQVTTAPPDLRTYGRDGQSSALGKPDPGFNKRA
ncbi:hypothetical protein [Maritimibacter sp. DP1N21-5]|uniref:hypothetical protein n=1 Tax=Maritimibacter sp. DP1N21-5 TaxID=2836867 RepID=UPI001C43CCA5|nr:hypothetical protein [Maritimibacter sp. DP1N21-5]MBV7407967.1 hypothetical protein [Maritimibacter sp. DP1N21-5]